MSIAVFGGTFDPVHLGHLIIAEQAYNSFQPEKIIFMPAGIPPHKDKTEISSTDHRLEMLKLAVNSNPHFEISQWELKNKERSYTVDTLKKLKKDYPSRKIYMIIGADSLLDIFNWKQPEYLLKNANFIVARRPEFLLKDIYLDQRFREYRDRINILDNSLIEISSSQIRKLCKEEKSIKYLTLNKIIDYIKNHNLYRSG